MFSVADWERYAIESRCAALYHGEYRLGMAGFREMVKAALMRENMRLLQRGYSTSLEFERWAQRERERVGSGGGRGRKREIERQSPATQRFRQPVI